MAQTMHLFSKFPEEVRLYIWQDAMLPRVVRANWDALVKLSGSKGNPKILFVNQESQHEALRRYEKLLGNDDIYVDFSQDTIFMDSMFHSERLDYRDDMVFKEQEPKIQILAVDHHWLRYFSYKFLEQIRRCIILRKLLIVMPCLESDDYDDDSTFSELINLRYLVTFRDLHPYNFDLFDSVSGMVTRCMKDGERVDGDKYWPDVYLVTYYNGMEVVRYPGSLTDMYERSPALDIVVRSREQVRGHRPPVPAFEMSMLLEEVTGVGKN
jgi:hypothetical protein